MKFSIIIPTYNQANLLEKALKSIAIQTFKDFEIIIVNNFSNDNTLDVISTFDFLNLQTFDFQNNGIIAAARNYGVSRAKGKFVCFLDSDDEWYAEKLSIINSTIEKKSCGLLVHDEYWLYSNSKKILKTYGPEKNFNPKFLIYNRNCISTSAVTICRKIFDSVNGFNEQKKYLLAEDYELWIRLSLIGVKCEFIPIALGIYRIHSESNSRKLINHRKAQIEVINTYRTSIKMSLIQEKFYFYRRLLRIYVGSLIRYFGLQ